MTNAFQDNAQTLSHNIEILSEHIAAFTLDANVEWPYVTLPNFEQRVAPIRKDSMVDFFGFLPLVETMQRESWEDYVVNHQEWIQESYITLTHSIQHSKEAAIYENYSSTKYSISPQISISVNGQKEPYIAVGPYAPLWQMSPPPPPEEANVINEDLMASPRFRNLFEAMQKQQMQSAISEVMDLDLFNDNDNHNDNHNNQSVAPGENHLKSAIFQPIYDSYTHNINSSKAAAIKGFALGVFSWKQFFSGVLPNGVNGIDCVLNFCGHSVHSFRIDGEKVTCIGEGSLQENQFSGYAVEAEMDFFHSYDSREDGSCTYSIAIYPSDRFRSSFETKQSAIFTAVIAAVFVGTGLVFLLYVYIIGRRQNKVMDIAMGTSAIVASLFPKTVRDKIILDAQEEVQRRRGSVQLPERGGDSTHGSMVSRGRRRSSLLSIQNQRQRRQQQGEQPQRGKPIADLFPAATGELVKLLSCFCAFYCATPFL